MMANDGRTLTELCAAAEALLARDALPHEHVALLRLLVVLLDGPSLEQASEEHAAVICSFIGRNLANEVVLQELDSDVQDALDDLLGGVVARLRATITPTPARGLMDTVTSALGQWIETFIPWSPQPVTASSGSVGWPDFEIQLQSYQIGFEGGHTDPETGRTTLQLVLNRGARFPAPAFDVRLITEDGEVIDPEGGTQANPGNLLEFRGITHPRKVRAVRVRLIESRRGARA